VRSKHRLYRLVGILLILLSILGWVLAAYATSPGRVDQPADATAPEPAPMPNTDVNPFGANFFLAREVEPWKREKTVQMAAQAGLGWAKQQFVWAEIEPLRKGEFVDPNSQESSWAKYDEIVDLYRRYGLRVIARIDRAPVWARPAGSPAEAPPASFEDLGDFVYAFASHFRGRVQYIQLWNEPNIYPEWGEQPVDPAAYTEMLALAYQRAKEADPNVFVLSAPLAPTLGEPHPEPGRWRSMNDLDYLEAMFQAGAGEVFDILSVNAFGFDLPPADPPDPQVLNFQRVALLRQIVEESGAANKPVWINEYGWNAAPISFDEANLTWERVSEEQQAEYTLQGIEWARQEWPWVGVFAIWYFRQVGQQYSPEDAAYYFRMVDVDFTPRRVYDAVQDATRSLRVASRGYVEETNPAVEWEPGWQAAIESQASAQAYLESDQPGDSLTFTFRGSTLGLVTRQDVDGGRLLVTLDGRAVSRLPTDNQGRSYLDLYAPAPEWQVTLPVVDGALPGQHVVRLTVSDQPGSGGGFRCAVDALVVDESQRRSFPWLPVSLLGLGSLTMVALLVRELRLIRRPQVVY
jgi:hypothetical protein